VDQIVGSFDFTGIAEGTEMLTALLNGSMAQATINVTSTGGLVINEVDYDQVGTDADEFVEIYNGSAAPVSLQGIALVFVNGGGNSEYARIDLSSVGTLLGGEYLVVGSTVLLQSVPSTAKSKELPLATNNIQNGAPDAVGLLDVGASALIDALSYEGGITMGQVNGAGVLSFVEGTVLPTNVADSNQTKGSLIRFPNGTDTDDAAADWKFSPTVTPGSANL
jgi:hypothetical protein